MYVTPSQTEAASLSPLLRSSVEIEAVRPSQKRLFVSFFSLFLSFFLSFFLAVFHSFILCVCVYVCVCVCVCVCVFCFSVSCLPRGRVGLEAWAWG